MWETAAEDATDRRDALAAAAVLASRRGDAGIGRAGRDEPGEPHWLRLADDAYRWLRERHTLHLASVAIVPGTPYTEGTAPMTATLNLQDSQEVVFTLGGADAKGAPVDLPATYTASWTLADPDGSGAVLTPSADTTSATLAAGTPDTNVLVSVTVTVTNSDGSTSTYQGAEAVIVTAGDLSTVTLVPGTPSPEAPAAP